MQIYARDHVEVHPQKKKEVLYLAKKREKYNSLRNEIRRSSQLRTLLKLVVVNRT